MLILLGLLVLASPICLGWGGGIYQITVSASPGAVYINGRTSTVTAHVTRDGYPVQGHTIQFSIISGAGSVSPGSRDTNADGNATTTYTSGANPGPVTVQAKDLDETGQPSATCTIKVFRISQNQRFWWFDGVSPGNQPGGYELNAILTAEGSTTGSFTWEVTSGFEDAGFLDGGQIKPSITLPNTNQVTLRAKDESAAPYSVRIKFAYNGSVVINTWDTTVRTAKSLRPHADDVPKVWEDGYVTEIWYEIWDNVGELFPQVNIGVNEEWVTCPCGQHESHVRWDDTQNNWPDPQAKGTGVNPRAWADYLGAKGFLLVPDPVGPDDPGAGTMVFHLGQRWRVGSSVSGVGVRVQTDRAQMFRGYGDHLNISTP